MTSSKHKVPFGPDKVFSEKPDSVFVFGSNLAGVHAGGAAKVAHKKYNARNGVGFGFQHGLGPLYSYALPTKDHQLQTLYFTEIAYWVDRFNQWAVSNSFRYNDIFVTKIGCGLAGWSEEHIAPLFQQYYWPGNVILPTGWHKDA